FQNTVSMNGADFRVDPSLGVRLLGMVEGPGFCYTAGDATAGFAVELGVARYLRQLVLIEGCLIVYDNVRLASPVTRVWYRFQWTLHSDPATHRLACAGSSATWRPLTAGAPALVLDVLEPSEFAWEQATLQVWGGRAGTHVPGGLEALRLVRPEWYADRMPV